MSIEKKYLKTRNVCKVTFKLSPEESGEAQTAFLVGEFNDWDMSNLPMKKRKDGTFTITIDLPVGHNYQFRYFLDNERWENDWSADSYCYSEFGNCENSVVDV
ncbi:MAG: isoamylase early set domain-containing protein [Desulfomicrobium sp.]|jgi:1,4-alpha-glucan branching enzyme|nr:isoamylase early set domain-containing protein [Desulfomicrobium sp.]NLV95896.1 glycoside hydrolase [Desulfovibrionales bacterium]